MTEENKHPKQLPENAKKTRKVNRKQAKNPPAPKVKPRNDGRSKSSVLTLDKVEEMWRAYLEDTRPISIATKCNVHINTVYKYIKYGQPKRGIKSFLARDAARRDGADKKAVDKIAQAEASMMEATLGTLGLIKYALSGLAEKVKNKEKISIDPHRIPSMLKDLNGIVRYAKGDPDKKVEIENKFKNWSVEELEEYYLTGKLPAHAENDPNAPRYMN